MKSIIYIAIIILVSACNDKKVHEPLTEAPEEQEESLLSSPDMEMAIAQEIYEENCLSCHGPEGNQAADIRMLPSETFVSAIRVGRAEMPAFKEDKIEDSEFPILKLYVDSLAKERASSALPPPNEELAVISGEALYHTHCQRCHGQDGSGENGVTITDTDNDYFMKVIRNGAGKMPSFSEETLTQNEIESLKFYVESFKVTKPPVKPPVDKPDLPKVKSGAELYQNFCLRCHKEDGKGVSGVFISQLSSKRFEKVVRNGAVKMPKFDEEKLSNKELSSIKFYIDGLNSVAPVLPPATVESPLLKGMNLYTSKCMRCHLQMGGKGQGGSLFGESLETYIKTVREGDLMAIMPKWNESELSDKEIELIKNFVDTFEKK